MELKIPMQFYNLFQVVLSAYITYEAWMAGWGTHYNWGECRIQYDLKCKNIHIILILQ